MTIAQQVANQFNSATHTISIATIAQRYHAAVTKQHSPDKITYLFDDGSSLITSGRGASHKIQVNPNQVNPK